MREIKFRAWDKKLKKMTYCDFAISPKGELSFYWQKEAFHSAHSFLMQFTGLKDKKGKEIYESDVVKLVGGSCNFLSCGNYGEKHDIGAVLVVSKLESGYTLQMPRHINEDVPNLVGNVGNYDLWNYQRSLEIIGNIYENPELLS